MMKALFMVLAGYLCGSLLSTKLYSILFRKPDPAKSSEDGNPGVFNAFREGGLWCGLFCLAFDLLKGFAPMMLYLSIVEDPYFGDYLGLMMAAPVWGHVYSIFNHFHGGKGITTTFGVLLALWAGGISAAPVLTLAALFILLRVIIHISPDLYMTAIVYILLPILCLQLDLTRPVMMGLLLISTGVLVRLALSREAHPALEVKPIWKR